MLASGEEDVVLVFQSFDGQSQEKILHHWSLLYTETRTYY